MLGGGGRRPGRIRRRAVRGQILGDPISRRPRFCTPLPPLHLGVDFRYTNFSGGRNLHFTYTYFSGGRGLHFTYTNFSGGWGLDFIYTNFLGPGRRGSTFS